MVIESSALLADYATNGSEDAFRELAARYFGLVYSSALRLVGGDTHRAEDVAQTVFADLAKHARAIPPAVMLGGWLHRRTFNVATTMMRSERRRKIREQEVTDMKAVEEYPDAILARIAPIVDEAITELKPEDRAAILLRFFEGRDLRSIGKVFGTNEDAAQKRVSRALDKMRLLLERRGAALSATALATALASEGLTAAPAALAAAAAPTAATALSVSTIVKMILMTPAKAWIITGSLVACISTASLVQLNLGHENQRLRQQLTHLAPLVIENERLSNQVSELLVANANAKEDENAIAKLRSEVGLLHKEKREMTDLRENLDRLSKELAQKGASNGPADDPQQRGVVLRIYNNASGFARELTQAMASVPEEQITQTFRRFLQENGISTSKPVIVLKDERNDRLLISASEADQNVIQKVMANFTEIP